MSLCHEPGTQPHRWGSWPEPWALRVKEVMRWKCAGGSGHWRSAPTTFPAQAWAVFCSQLWCAVHVGSTSCKPSSWVLGLQWLLWSQLSLAHQPELCESLVLGIWSWEMEWLSKSVTGKAFVWGSLLPRPIPTPPQWPHSDFLGSCQWTPWSHFNKYHQSTSLVPPGPLLKA